MNGGMLMADDQTAGTVSNLGELLGRRLRIHPIAVPEKMRPGAKLARRIRRQSARLQKLCELRVVIPGNEAERHSCGEFIEKSTQQFL